MTADGPSLCLWCLRALDAHTPYDGTVPPPGRTFARFQFPAEVGGSVDVDCMLCPISALQQRHGEGIASLIEHRRNQVSINPPEPHDD